MQQPGSKTTLGKIIRAGEITRKWDCMPGNVKPERREWSRCYCVITEQYLSFFFNKDRFDEDKPAMCTLALHSASCERIGSYKGKRRNVFRITSADGHSNLLQCFDDMDLTGWVFAAEDAITNSLARKIEGLQFDIMGLRKMIEKVQSNPVIASSGQDLNQFTTALQQKEMELRQLDPTGVAFLSVQDSNSNRLALGVNREQIMARLGSGMVVNASQMCNENAILESSLNLRNGAGFLSPQNQVSQQNGMSGMQPNIMPQQNMISQQNVMSPQQQNLVPQNLLNQQNLGQMPMQSQNFLPQNAVMQQPQQYNQQNVGDPSMGTFKRPVYGTQGPRAAAAMMQREAVLHNQVGAFATVRNRPPPPLPSMPSKNMNGSFPESSIANTSFNMQPQYNQQNGGYGMQQANNNYGTSPGANAQQPNNFGMMPGQQNDGYGVPQQSNNNYGAVQNPNNFGGAQNVPTPPPPPIPQNPSFGMQPNIVPNNFGMQQNAPPPPPPPPVPSPPPPPMPSNVPMQVVPPPPPPPMQQNSFVMQQQTPQMQPPNPYAMQNQQMVQNELQRGYSNGSMNNSPMGMNGNVQQMPNNRSGTLRPGMNMNMVNNMNMNNGLNMMNNMSMNMNMNMNSGMNMDNMAMNNNNNNGNIGNMNYGYNGNATPPPPPPAPQPQMMMHNGSYASLNRGPSADHMSQQMNAPPPPPPIPQQFAPSSPSNNNWMNVDSGNGYGDQAPPPPPPPPPPVEQANSPSLTPKKMMGVPVLGGFAMADAIKNAKLRKVNRSDERVDEDEPVPASKPPPSPKALGGAELAEQLRTVRLRKTKNEEDTQVEEAEETPTEKKKTFRPKGPAPFGGDDLLSQLKSAQLRRAAEAEANEGQEDEPPSPKRESNSPKRWDDNQNTKTKAKTSVMSVTNAPEASKTAPRKATTTTCSPVAMKGTLRTPAPPKSPTPPIPKSPTPPPVSKKPTPPPPSFVRKDSSADEESSPSPRQPPTLPRKPQSLRSDANDSESPAVLRPTPIKTSGSYTIHSKLPAPTSSAPKPSPYSAATPRSSVPPSPPPPPVPQSPAVSISCADDPDVPQSGLAAQLLAAKRKIKAKNG